MSGAPAAAAQLSSARTAAASTGVLAPLLRLGMPRSCRHPRPPTPLTTGSPCAVGDDAEDVPLPAVHRAHPVPPCEPVVPAAALPRPVPHREHHRLAQPRPQHDRPGLLARSL